MKTLLVTTLLSVAATAAFGAASLRAPQIGGTATVTTPAATTNTARAGTMRAQTMKTSSVSTPSVTTTQSIATPVSTETTDARIALLKGIKGFSPNKIKDTTTAQQELNAIDSRIEELQTQLDRAEAAQSTVLTEDTIDAKIEQKLTALGTSSSARETYSKAEVDNLLTALEKKLPTIDDKGNMTWTDPNGNLISQHAYWYARTLFNYIPQRVDLYEYSGTRTDETINTWVNNICDKTATNDRVACCRREQVSQLFFGVNQIFPGYEIVDSRTTVQNNGQLLLKQIVFFTENGTNSPETYIRSEFCGNRPETECWTVTDGYSQPCGVKVYTVFVYSKLGNPNSPTLDDKGNLNISDSSGTTIAQLLPYNLYSTHKHTNLSNTQTYKLIAPHDFGTSSFGSLAQEYTRNWVSNICAPEQSNPDLVACGFYNANGQDTAMTEFSTISCFKGMQKISSSVTDDGIQSQYTTFENLTQNQIRNRFCGELSNDECSISGYTETPMGACTEKTFTLTTSEGTVPLYAPSGTIVVVCPEGCHPKVHEGPNGVSVSCIDEHGKACGEKVIADNPSADQ